MRSVHGAMVESAMAPFGPNPTSTTAIAPHRKWRVLTGSEEGIYLNHASITTNLAWDSNKKPEKELILESSGRWFDEKRMYSYGQYSCGSSCHYTQMVWGSTSKVGCYSYRCPNLVYAYRNAWYLVCFYTPKGNWNGEKPYDKTCKTKCADGQTVDNGLCVGDAKGGNGPNAGGDDGGCDDDQGMCAEWAKNGQCQSNPNYMLKYCRKSCKVCVSNASCEDSNPGCEGWAKTGECRKNPAYMEKSCKKSCQKC